MRFVSTLFSLVLLCAHSSAQERPEPNSPLSKKYYFITDDNNRGKKVVAIMVKNEIKVTEDDLKELAQFTELESLRLAGQTITSTGIKHLANLKKLATLDLSFTELKADSVKELSKLTQLKRLNLLNSNYTPEDLKTLTALSDLESLWLGQNFACKDQDYTVLGEFKKLRRLAVSNSGFGDESLQVVAKLPELRDLRFPSCRVTDDGMQHLAKAPKLERFQGNFRMKGKGLAALGKIETLRQLDLFGTEVTLQEILAMPNLKNLTQLRPDFRGATAEADEKKLKATLPNCKFESIFGSFDAP